MLKMGGLQIELKEPNNYEKEFGDINLRSENFYSDYQYDKTHIVDTGRKVPWMAVYADMKTGWL